MLSLWRPNAELGATLRADWERAAYRIAFGIEFAGHLEPVLDTERLYTGFCAHSAEMADLLAGAIRRENVEADVVRAHPGASQESPCDVIVPCRPESTDEELDHAVLAAVKAAHVYFCSAPPR